MFTRIKSFYKAGRSGQPLPARADRSVGEAAGAAAVTIGLVAGCFFAIGAGGAAAERLFTSKGTREIMAAKQRLELADLEVRLEAVKSRNADQK